MTESSRRKAQNWPCPRHVHFEKALHKAAHAWFESKGFAVAASKDYCLADSSKWAQNIILPEVAQYINDEAARRSAKGVGFALHMGLHNGLSSQAMLFNLVGPLVLRHDFLPLEEALKQ